jgi:hypothetical protein
MITTGLIIACIVCIGLTILGYIQRNLPIIFISSLGYVICGLQIFQQTEEILPMVLMLFFAMGQFLIVKKEGA